MAFAKTTLSSACAAADNQIVVASATSVAAGRLVRIDDEFMQVSSSYVSGTTVPVRRGLYGSKTVAHPATANVIHGLTSDFADPAFGGPLSLVQAQRPTQLQSITTTPATLAFAPQGCDMRVILNGTAAIALTIPVPTKDMDGTELAIVSNGAAAHTLTFTGGLSGAGTSYDVITINATAPAAFKFVAVNELWMAYCGPAMGGTVTNIIGSVA